MLSGTMRRFVFLLLLIIGIFSFARAEQIGTLENDDKEYAYNASNKTNYCAQVYDPYEKWNRKIFALNMTLDKYLVKPVIVIYKNMTPSYVRARIGSFLENFAMPLTVVNYAAQINYKNTMLSFWRFMINSMFGIGGLFDVASQVGLKVTRQTFGSTLARYGVPPGPYIVLPFLGSTNSRDNLDLALNSFLNPLMSTLTAKQEIILTVLEIADVRVKIEPFMILINKSSDPYLATRAAVHQNRESKLNYPANFICPKPPAFNKIRSENAKPKKP